MACDMAMTAVKTVAIEKGKDQTEIDIKRYARVEKIPGGTMEESEVLRGVMFNKDVTHSRMRRLGSSVDNTCARSNSGSSHCVHACILAPLSPPDA